jgi:hypothetical protein
MSHETFTQEEYEKILKSKENPFVKKTPLTEKINTVTTKVIEKSNGLLEGLILLTIVFWYFFFTGLALLFKRKLPQGWLRIATRIEKGSISHLLKKTGLKMQYSDKQARPMHPKYKVVDLDTHKAVKLPRTS